MNVTLTLARPYPRQREILDDPCPKKLWRAGRRTGKSVMGEVAAIRGHGPQLANGQRMHRGMLDGGNIAWLTKTYKQSKVVWRRLLKRFRPLEGVLVRIDREDKRIEVIGNGGALTVWSGHTRDAIDNLRGDAYDGVLLDEAAYIDAEYAITEVAEPALLDNGGWMIVFSSPNAGWDGNEQRVTPSYFNRLCQAVMDGDKPAWRQWHNATADNPKLDPARVAALRAEYPEDSPTVQQEMDALLLAGGLLALRIDRERVVVPAREVPAHWTWFGAVDWGYSHPWSFGLFAMNESGVVTLVESATGRKQEPDKIFASVKAVLASRGITFAKLTYTVAGGDVFDEHGKSRGLSGQTIEQQWGVLGWSVLRSTASGSGQRVLSLNNLRSYLAEDRFRVFDTPENRRTLAVLESRISDPLNPEDVLKVDADQNGIGGDDPYDMVRYGLYSRPIMPKAPKEKRRDVNTAEPLQEMARKYGKLAIKGRNGAVRVPRTLEVLT